MFVFLGLALFTSHGILRFALVLAHHRVFLFHHLANTLVVYFLTVLLLVSSDCLRVLTVGNSVTMNMEVHL